MTPKQELLLRALGPNPTSYASILTMLGLGEATAKNLMKLDALADGLRVQGYNVKSAFGLGLYLADQPDELTPRCTCGAMLASTGKCTVCGWL